MIHSDVAGNKGTRFRRGLLLGSLALAFACTLTMLHLALEHEEIKSFKTDLNAEELAVRSARIFRNERAKRDVHNILILGDSMLMQLEEPGFERSHTLPGRLKQALRRLDPEPVPHVVSIPIPGSSYTTFYFLADQLIAARPDQVLLEFNPGAMSAAWRGGKAPRKDQVAYLGWRRIPEALTLPLHHFGLTADRVLWTVACQELGCLGLWREVAEAQGRVTKLRGVLHLRAAKLTGSLAEERFVEERKMHRYSRYKTLDRRRRTKPSYERAYEDALAGADADDVSIQIMSATVRRFVSAGIPTLVFVVPVNVEHMREVGALTDDGLQRSLDNLGASVRAAGGAYIDFHELLSDEYFLDTGGHLTFEDETGGSVLLARELAPLILEQASIVQPDPGGVN